MATPSIVQAGLTGHRFKEALALANLSRRDFTYLADISEASAFRFFRFGDELVRTTPGNMKAMLEVLRLNGVEVGPDGPRKVERAAA